VFRILQFICYLAQSELGFPLVTLDVMSVFLATPQKLWTKYSLCVESDDSVVRKVSNYERWGDMCTQGHRM